MEEFHSLLILMVVVWVMGKIFRMLTLPVISGELLGGVIVGPLVLGIVNPESHTIKILAELGIFFLMLHAGLETDPNSLFKGSKKSVPIALGGVILPFFGGFLVSQAFGFSTYQSLFVALVLSVTAIAVSVRILKDYKLQNTRFGHTILAAALLSDIIILITFSVILKLVETGTVNPYSIVLMLLKTLLFFALVILGGIKLKKYISGFFDNKGFTLTLVIALFLGLIAEWIGLHVIIGAFLAGLFVHEELFGERVFQKIEDRIYGLSYSFLGPIFFTSLAFNLDFKGIVEAPNLFYALFAVAFLGKLIGSGGAALLQKIKPMKSLMTGLAMNSRGAIDLVIVSVGLQQGVIGKEIFSVLVVVAFIATLLTSLTIRPVKKHVKLKYR